MREEYCRVASELDSAKEAYAVAQSNLDQVSCNAEKYKTQRNELHSEAASLRTQLRQVQQKFDKAKEKMALVRYFETPEYDEEEFKAVTAVFAGASDQSAFLVGMHNRIREERAALRCVEDSKERWRENATELKTANKHLLAQLATERKMREELGVQIKSLRALVHELKCHRPTLKRRADHMVQEKEEEEEEDELMMHPKLVRKRPR